MSETLIHKGIAIEVEPLALADRLAEIQFKTIQQVIVDPQKWIDAYYKKFGNKNVNSDDAKTLFHEYEIEVI